MLDRLRVENLVLIRDAELELAPGLNVLTGETGAGKTIVAQAVGLLLGGRADPALVGPAGGEAYVEAAFAGVAADDLPAALRELAPEDEDELVLARRVVTDGRSRALAWGRSCTRGDLEEAGGALLEIVSQHEARRLARPAVQLDVLDATLGERGRELRSAMAARWRDLAAARRALEAAGAGAEERARALVELAALAEAVEEVRPEPAEEDALAADRERLRHVDDLLGAALGAADRVNPEDGAGALSLAGEAARLVERAAALDPALEAQASELRDAAARLQEAASALRAYADGLDAAPGRLDAVETRLGVLADLRRRFGGDPLDRLLTRAVEAREQLDAAAAGVRPEAALEVTAAAAEEAARAVAAELARDRRAAAPQLAAAVEGHLAELGMEAARLEVAIDERELGPRGSDAVELRLAANPGLPATALGTGASGGELSRIGLAVRLAARRRANETLVFDEVDAGIGGTTARALGEKLRRLADDAQLLCITHLPQIAALADRHFRVEKRTGEPSETVIERLDGDAVLDELVRMLGAEAGDRDALALATSLRGR